MQKLTDQQIVRLHTWLRQGIDKIEIARRLGVHRNTITSHAAGRVAYMPKLALQIGPVFCEPSSPGKPMQLATEQLDFTQPLTIYQAAPLLPDQPSVSRIHSLIKQGVLKTTRQNGRLYTKLPWVRRAAQKMLPVGLYFRNGSLQVYASQPELLLKTIEHKRVPSPCRQVSYYRAPLVFASARALDIAIRIPSYRVTIAVEILDLIGVHVI